MVEKAEKKGRGGGRPPAHVGFSGEVGLALAVLILALEDLRGKHGPRHQEDARRWWGSDGWREMVEGFGLDPESVMRIT